MGEPFDFKGEKSWYSWTSLFVT